MARRIYSGNEIPHLFAADRNADVTNNGGSLHVERGVLWSYQQPIAAYFGDLVLISSDSFSVTTSKHQAWTRYALNHLKTLPVPQLERLLGNNSEKDVAEYVAARSLEIENLRAKKLRSEWKMRERDSDIANLEAACEFAWNVKLGKKTPWQSAIKAKAKNDKAAKIARFQLARGRLDSGMFHATDITARCREQMAEDLRVGRGGLNGWWRLGNAINDINRIDEMFARRGFGVVGSNAVFEESAKLMGKKWAKECVALAVAISDYAQSFQAELDQMRAAYDAAESLAEAETVAEWIAGGTETPRGAVVCRVIGDRVETSKGARVPLAEALQFAELAKRCRETGKAIDLNGRVIGAYRGNKIDAQGNMTIGCHYISWDAIAACVARYEESLA